MEASYWYTCIAMNSNWAKFPNYDLYEKYNHIDYIVEAMVFLEKLHAQIGEKAIQSLPIATAQFEGKITELQVLTKQIGIETVVNYTNETLDIIFNLPNGAQEVNELFASFATWEKKSILFSNVVEPIND